MKGNNIHFAKSAVWGVFFNVFSNAFNLRDEIPGGSGTWAEKPDERMPGWK